MINWEKKVILIHAHALPTVFLWPVVRLTHKLFFPCFRISGYQFVKSVQPWKKRLFSDPPAYRKHRFIGASNSPRRKGIMTGKRYACLQPFPSLNLKYCSKNYLHWCFSPLTKSLENTLWKLKQKRTRLMKVSTPKRTAVDTSYKVLRNTDHRDFPYFTIFLGETA